MENNRCVLVQQVIVKAIVLVRWALGVVYRWLVVLPRITMATSLIGRWSLSSFTTTGEATQQGRPVYIVIGWLLNRLPTSVRRLTPT